MLPLLLLLLLLLRGVGHASTAAVVTARHMLLSKLLGLPPLRLQRPQLHDSLVVAIVASCAQALLVI